MEIITLPVGQMQSNCYLVIDEKSQKTIIIDAGDDAEYIERTIADRKLIPELIVATHGHFDHIMAVLELTLAYKIPFKLNCEDKFLVKNMRDSAKHFLSFDPGPPPIADGCLNDGEVIKIGSLSLSVISVPGHTPGSICLYHKEDNKLFTGDTLFADGGIGRTDFKYSNHEKILESIQNIFKLPASTEIYPGHGRSSTLEEEKSNFNF